MQVVVEEVFEEEDSPTTQENESAALMSYDDFLSLMTENNILPLFFNPHKSSDAEQHKAFKDMSPEEREVISLLGIELQCKKQDILIQVGSA